MTSKLEIYNNALGYLGERKLSSLTESREPRRVLDDFYDTVTKYCLERGFWNWAMRTIQQDSSDSYTPAFGLTYAFEKPTDWVRTYSASSSERMSPPLLDLVDEGGFWYSDSDPIFVKYLSNGTTWGMDLSLWSQGFADYVALRLACRSCKRITGNMPDEDLLREERRTAAIAKSKDAMDEPPAFPPSGTWVNARRNGPLDRRRWNGENT